MIIKENKKIEIGLYAPFNPLQLKKELLTLDLSNSEINRDLHKYFFITHKIYCFSLFKKDEEYTTVHKDVFFNKLNKAYPRIKNHLIQLGYISCDGFYIEDEKTYGYKINGEVDKYLFKWNSSKLINTLIIENRSKKFEKSLVQLHTPELKRLYKTLQKIEIDHIHVTNKNDSNLLERVKNGLFIKQGKNSNRIYSNFTSLGKHIRDQVKIDGIQLENFDVMCCQPVLFLNVIKDKVGTLDPKSLELYQTCKEGYFYEHVAKLLKRDISTNIKRDAFKKEFYQFLNSENLYGDFKYVLQKYYPQIYKGIKAIKKEHSLAEYLQRKESLIIFETLNNLNKQIDVLTCHDSFYYKPENFNMIFNEFKKVCRKYGIECNVKDSNGELFEIRNSEATTEQQVNDIITNEVIHANSIEPVITPEIKQKDKIDIEKEFIQYGKNNEIYSDLIEYVENKLFFHQIYSVRNKIELNDSIKSNNDIGIVKDFFYQNYFAQKPPKTLVKIIQNDPLLNKFDNMIESFRNSIHN